MPSFNPKTSATATTDFSWEAFPEPPPEAENWKPDPDSVPTPGLFHDRRLRRDPVEDRRLAAKKKQMRMLCSPSESVTSSNNALTSPSSLVNGTATAGLGLGGWPAPVLRASGCPRDLVQKPTPAPSTSSLDADFDTAKPPYENISPRPKSQTTCPTAATKGTMEDLRIVPSAYVRAQSPIAVMKAVESASPTMTELPSWAAPLEKALREESKAKTEPIKKPTVSVPAHLRKTSVRASVSTVLQPSPSGHLQLNPSAQAYEPGIGMTTAAVSKQEMNMKDEALARKMAMEEFCTEVEDGLRLQQNILDMCKMSSPVLPVSMDPNLPTNTEAELESFRQQWREEVTARAKDKAPRASAPAKAVASSSKHHAAKSSASDAVPSTHARQRSIEDTDEVVPYVYHHLAVASSAPSIVATRTTDPDYGHYMKVHSIIMMEQDMDLDRRATKRELMAMNSNDIDKYMMKVSSAHQHWWEAEQRLAHDNGS